MDGRQDFNYKILDHFVFCWATWRLRLKLKKTKNNGGNSSYVVEEDKMQEKV